MYHDRVPYCTGFWVEEGGRVAFPCDPAHISTANPGLFPAIPSLDSQAKSGMILLYEFRLALHP
jgi:hypothetical protein